MPTTIYFYEFFDKVLEREDDSASRQADRLDYEIEVEVEVSEEGGSAAGVVVPWSRGVTDFELVMDFCYPAYC